MRSDVQIYLDNEIMSVKAIESSTYSHVIRLDSYPAVASVYLSDAALAKLLSSLLMYTYQNHLPFYHSQVDPGDERDCDCDDPYRHKPSDHHNPSA